MYSRNGHCRCTSVDGDLSQVGADIDRDIAVKGQEKAPLANT